MTLLGALAQAGATAFSHGAQSPLATWLFSHEDDFIATRSGQRVNAETAMSCNAVYACVQILARALASLPINVFERREVDGRKGLHLATEHPLFPILHRAPNPEQSRYTWVEMMMGHLTLRHNCYSFIERSRAGEVIALWPIHPSAVTVKRNDANDIVYDVRDSKGRIITYPAEMIFHVKGLSSFGLTGDGPLKHQRQQIGSSLAADSYSQRFFSNNGTPEGYLKIEGKISTTSGQTADAVRKEISRDWRNNTTGANRHATPVLDNGMEWVKVGLSPEDAQLLQTRRFSLEEISRMFQVPLVMLNQTEKTTTWGTGVEQIFMAFVTYSLGPWIENWQQEMERKLLLPQDQGKFVIDMDVTALLLGDRKSLTEWFAALKQWGIATTNEMRDLINLNPIEGGDALWMPSNMIEVGNAPSDTNDGDNDTGRDRLTRTIKDLLLHRETMTVGANGIKDMNGGLQDV